LIVEKKKRRGTREKGGFDHWAPPQGKGEKKGGEGKLLWIIAPERGVAGKEEKERKGSLFGHSGRGKKKGKNICHVSVTQNRRGGENKLQRNKKRGKKKKKRSTCLFLHQGGGAVQGKGKKKKGENCFQITCVPEKKKGEKKGRIIPTSRRLAGAKPRGGRRTTGPAPPRRPTGGKKKEKGEKKKNGSLIS